MRRNSVYRLITVTAMLLLLLSYTPMSAQPRSLFLIAGQSNAVGYGDSSLSVKVKPGTAWEYRYLKDQVVALKDPVGEYNLNFEQSNTGSAWTAFAERYARLSNSQVTLVPCARGGSSCSAKAEIPNCGTWDVNGYLFPSTIVKIQRAVKVTGIPLKGIIWLQGERDANAITNKELSEAEYQQTLEELIKRFRKAINKRVPFFIVLTGGYQNHPDIGFDIVRSVQARVASSLPEVYIVFTGAADFIRDKKMKDDIHYNQVGLNELGQATADNIARILNK